MAKLHRELEERLVLNWLLKNPKDCASMQAGYFEVENAKVFRAIQSLSNDNEKLDIGQVYLKDKSIKPDVLKDIEKKRCDHLNQPLEAIQKAYLIRRGILDGKKWLCNEFTNADDSDFTKMFDEYNLNGIINYIKDHEKWVDEVKIKEFNPFEGYDIRTLPGANEELKSLVDGMFYKGTFSGIIGPAKVGKTMLVYSLCYAIEKGFKFLNHETHKAHCLYLDWEMSIPEINDRFNKIEEFYGEENGSWPEIAPLYRTAYSFDETVRELGATLRKKPEIEVVFLDNFYSFYDGNPNDSIEVKKALNKIASACGEKVTIFMVCHTNKDDGKNGGSTDPVYAAAGSSALSGYLSDFISITDYNPDTKSKMIDGRFIYHAGRHFTNSGKIACRYDSTTNYCYQYIEDASEIKCEGERKPLTKEELKMLFPEICNFIGDEGKTITQIKKEFPDETGLTLKNKGFYCNKNKERCREGFVTGRWYMEDPNVNV